MSWQRPMGIWELWDGLRAILESGGIPAPLRTPEMDRMAYARLRTGLDYRSVWAMLWVESDDSRLWVRKSRGPVLRLWRGLKKDIWQELRRREDEAAATVQPAATEREPGCDDDKVDEIDGPRG